MRLGVVMAAVALLLAGAASSGTQAPRQAQVRITMTSATCRAAPASVEPGSTVFLIANRTRRPRLFTIAGRRTRYIRPRRSGALRVGLGRQGVYRFFCVSRGPRRFVRTGVIAVRPRSVKQAPPAEHRIGVRLVGKAGEFYDRETGNRFVPRGNNYLRRADQEIPGGETVFHGSTFIVGRYEPARIEAALEQMHADGYNATRVILDVVCRKGCLGDFNTGRLSADYVDNVADFLRRAKANDVYVMLANEGDVPAGTVWAATVNRSCCASFAGRNLYYLTAGGLEGTQAFWQAFLRALISRNAPLDVVFAYSLANEAYYERDRAPLTQTSGTVTTANGSTYDIASAVDRQRMMDENLVNFVDRVRASIREVDPTALVGTGLLWPQSPNPARGGDPRLIHTEPLITDSALDFIDLHLYPARELTFSQYTENFGLQLETAKPVVMGEYGLSKSAQPNVDEAAYALQDWQRVSCAYGFDGWLLSTLDTTEAAPGEPDLWTATENGGVIERALSPSTRPDPCAPATGPHNVALRMAATASHSQPGSPPSLAVDGLTNTAWASADEPPQWLKVDLGSPHALLRIRLRPTQFPDGFTTHRVWGQATAGDPEQLLHVFSGFTQSDEVLEFTPATPWHNIRYVRVETVLGPSRVGWREVELISPS